MKRHNQQFDSMQTQALGSASFTIYPFGVASFAYGAV